MKLWLIGLMVAMMASVVLAASPSPAEAEAAAAATQSSTEISDDAPASAVDLSDDFSPGQAAFVLVMLIVLAMAAIAGAITLVILAVIALLGIVSTSTVVGIVKRSTGAAIRAFAYQALALAGLLTGMVAGLAVHWLEPHAAPKWGLIAVGGGTGALLGLLLAAALVWAVRAMWRAAAK